MGRWRNETRSDENYWFSRDEITVIRGSFRRSVRYSILSTNGAVSSNMLATVVCKDAAGKQWNIDLKLADEAKRMTIVDHELDDVEAKFGMKAKPEEFVFVDTKGPPAPR